jgi:hypothetical protein
MFKQIWSTWFVHVIVALNSLSIILSFWIIHFMFSMLRDSFLDDVRGVHPLAATYLGRNSAEVYLEEAFRHTQDQNGQIRQLHHMPTLLLLF